jgi:hypothetical protein
MCAWAVMQNLVGYNKLAVLTLNEELHLDAMLKFSTPNRHMVGNCDLCLFLMLHGWPMLMYC